MRRSGVMNVLCAIACILLLAVGILHMSGINYINDMVQQSDVSDLVKQIFPILFLAPSIQLIVLAIFGLIALSKPSRIVYALISVFVLIDAIFAFWLNALIPGVILLLPGVIFVFLAWKPKTS
ncbi:hypothetical protein [Marinoscillum sp.]|uniref:hypothetical protein n=1 Tax=Marinoscillum sp. TaxID=2024838 RepID=UPI003BA97380